MLTRLLIAAALSAAAASASAAPYTAIANPAARNGSERCATEFACAPGGQYGGLSSVIDLFARSQGATAQRVADGSDQIWTALPGAGVFGVGRAAGNDSTLGLLAGLSGGAFTQVLGTIGSGSSPAEFLPGSFIAQLSARERAPGDLRVSAKAGAGSYDGSAPIFQPLSMVGPFRFALHGVSVAGDWSTQDADNAKQEGGVARDHAVTWELHSAALTASGTREFVESFEDAAFAAGGDGDFNDYTFAFRNIVPAGAAVRAGVAVPEPATAAVLGATLIAAGVWRRRRVTLR